MKTIDEGINIFDWLSMNICCRCSKYKTNQCRPHVRLLTHENGDVEYTPECFSIYIKKVNKEDDKC